MWYGMREDWSDVVWNERGLEQCETRYNGVVWNERGLDGIDKVRHDILRENLDWCD